MINAGVTIGGKHSYNYFKMLPKSKLVFVRPKAKLNTIDVPGMDGVLDYSNILTGNMTYENRKGTLEFYMQTKADYLAKYSECMTFFNGSARNAILDDDPNYFYTGRFTVEDFRPYGREGSKVLITYDVDPYKYPIDSTISHDWLWNDLFDTTIYYGTFDVTTSKQRNLINPSGSNVTPTFTCSDDFVVAFNGVNYPLDTGTTSQPGFALAPGDNYMTFYGTGRVMVDYSIGKSL